MIVKPLPKLTPALTKSDRALCERIKTVTRGEKLRNAKRAALRRLFKEA